MKSGNLNFLEPSGPLQACNGTALPFLYEPFWMTFVSFKHLMLLRFNPLNAELNPICHLLALLGAHHIFHVSELKAKFQALPSKERGFWLTASYSKCIQWSTAIRGLYNMRKQTFGRLTSVTWNTKCNGPIFCFRGTFGAINFVCRISV